MKKKFLSVNYKLMKNIATNVGKVTTYQVIEGNVWLWKMKGVYYERIPNVWNVTQIIF